MKAFPSVGQHVQYKVTGEVAECLSLTASGKMAEIETPTGRLCVPIGEIEVLDPVDELLILKSLLGIYRSTAKEDLRERPR